jgi:hypothetical protein
MGPGTTITLTIADMPVPVIILTKKKKNGGMSGVCSKDNMLHVNYGFKIQY